jgi:agmatinase
MFNVRERLPVKKLVHVGLRDVAESEVRLIRESGGRHEAFFDHDIAKHRMSGQPFKALVDRMVTALPNEVYVSFDIDGLDPALCPNTGTPVPGGLAWHEALSILAAVRSSGRKIVGFDLNEVAPGEGGDEWDGNVGARLLYKMCGFTLLGQHRGKLRSL